MNVLGEGQSRGGISILHALGLGKGCSIGIDLFIKVELIDEINENPEDKHALLDSVMACWEEAGLPTIPQYGWKISSEIPIGYGLKSSSALACAAIKSLNSALWTKLNDEEIVNLAVEAQRRAGCTITGSVDDSWGSITKGWKLIDSTRKISDSILIEGEIEDKLCVLIGIRGSRSSKISTESFSQYHELFERSLTSLKKGDIFAAMTTNGVAVAAASEDDEALRICNSAIIKGAISAGISGSGPAISIICHESEISDISELLMDNGMAVIETSLPHSTERSVPI